MCKQSFIEAARAVGEQPQTLGIDADTGLLGRIAAADHPLTGGPRATLAQVLLDQRFSINDDVLRARKRGLDLIDGQAALLKMVEHQLTAPNRSAQRLQRATDMPRRSSGRALVLA